jgi:glycosyltransferase involved in cell wall biosynthesis
MSAPVVSVIIANFNRANLLDEAITSVANQTFQDFELIVFDDGSRDHSVDIIRAHRKRMPDQLRFYTHDGGANLGIVATYREAILRARSEYIAFLENDDQWSPNYLEKKVEILNTYPEVGVVFSPYKVLSEGWFGKDMMLRQWLLRATIKSGQPFDNFSNLLQSNNVATFSCFMTRKHLIEDLMVPPGHILAFDWWMLTQLSTKCLFFFDKSSHTLWRWSRQSAIGRQRFKEHKTEGCNYMALMYRQIETMQAAIPSDKCDTFQDYQENFSYFLNYYSNPSFKRFWEFFRRTPIWALASTASLVINFLKFR